MDFPIIPGFELLEIVGEGSCGVVYRAKDLASREDVAVKVFIPERVNSELLELAAQGLEDMPPHPGLVAPSRYQSKTEPLYWVMPLYGEYAQDGWKTVTLEAQLSNHSHDNAWKLIYEIGDAMAWLHKHSLVHTNLRPSNILVHPSSSSSLLLTDFVQGWVGGLQQFYPHDHWFYLSPEQMQFPDKLMVQACRWDVYSFGVLAYRILTGKFPRAMSLMATLGSHAIPDPKILGEVDPQLVLETVLAEEQITWPNEDDAVWNERRREIITKCLHLNPADRWVDMREVMREFERLETDFLLEDVKLRAQQAKPSSKSLLTSFYAYLAGALAVGLIIALLGAGYYRKRVQETKQIASQHERDVAKKFEEKNGDIEKLSRRLSSLEKDYRIARTNLRSSHDAVDQLLTLLLQLPTGAGLQAEITESQIADALAFYDQDREFLSKESNAAFALARNYFNTAQLLLRQRKSKEAYDYFVKSRELLLSQTSITQDAEQKKQMNVLLGRASRWLGTLQLQQSAPTQAFNFFREAVELLSPIQKSDPKNRVLRYETAMAWFELGSQARRDILDKSSLEGLERVQELLQEAAVGGELADQERFLKAKSQMEQGLVLRDQGKVDDAVKNLFEAMEIMVSLVEATAPRHPDRALALAEAYLEFGELVSGKLGSSDSMAAQKQANTLLTELTTSLPDWVEPKLLLARNYGDMASLERDLGNGPEAIRRQQLAIDLLEELVKSTSDRPRVLLEYARQLSHLGQLLVDLRRPKDAVDIQKKSIQVTKELLQKESEALDEIDRRDALILMARVHGYLATTHQILKNKAAQIESLTAASAVWNELYLKYAQMTEVSEAKASAEDQLKKLQ